jgi:hypothetical protein
MVTTLHCHHLCRCEAAKQHKRAKAASRDVQLGAPCYRAWVDDVYVGHARVSRARAAPLVTGATLLLDPALVDSARPRGDVDGDGGSPCTFNGVVAAVQPNETWQRKQHRQMQVGVVMPHVLCRKTLASRCTAHFNHWLLCLPITPS